MDTITTSPFGALNYSVVAAYLLGMLAIGYWCSRRVTSARAFYIADGRLNPVVVGVSILGIYLSALTMMALPAISFGKHDFLWSVQLPFLVLTAFVITRLVLPRYRKAGVISVYEYLEQRIHISCRVLASLSFVTFSIGRMGIVMFLPALAFHIVTGCSLEATILVMGLVVTIYTVMGGMEAIVWTDVIQVGIFVFAAVYSVIAILGKTGGAGFMEIANAHHKFRTFEWSLNLRELTTWWLVLQTIFETIRIYGTQQDMAQRYMTTESVEKANKSVWIGAVGYIPMGYIFYFIGVALFVFYQAQPDPNVPKLVQMGRSDSIYPYFIATQLPQGLAGLLIAAIFAAAMSSIDALMNSSSTVCVEDFYKRFWKPNESDRHYLVLARSLTFLWGILATTMALACMLYLKKAQVFWSKWMAISCNGVLGLMALAFLPFRVNKWAAVIGFAVSYAVLFYVQFGTDINFLLRPVIGNLVCFFVALLLHAMFASPMQIEELKQATQGQKEGE